MMIAMRMDIRHERTESGADATAEERLTMMIDTISLFSVGYH